MAVDTNFHDSSYALPREASASGVDSVGFRAFAYVIGPAIVFLLTMTYMFAPDFYLTWVLHHAQREYQVVEVITVAAAFAAAILLGVWVWRAWPNAVGSERLAVLGIAVVALASFFFAGEEISWGQTYLGWQTPDSYLAYARETNLHNTGIPTQSLGTVFLIVVFFVVPIVWALGQRFHWGLPAGWKVLVAEGPVIACMASALIWQETKGLYRFIHADYVERATYIEFFEQLNEQKELLVAVALLLYAIYRFRYRFSARPAKT
jgi:hypothetical protein